MSDLYFMKREPENEYHARSRSGEFLSSHMLAEFRRSPFRYHQKLTGAIADPDKAEYAFGRAAHKMILEGHAAFELAYTVSDGPVNERTGKPYGKDSKAYQEWLAEQEHEVVTSSDYETIFAMDKNILSHLQHNDSFLLICFIKTLIAFIKIIIAIRVIIWIVPVAHLLWTPFAIGIFFPRILICNRTHGIVVPVLIVIAGIYSTVFTK